MSSRSAFNRLLLSLALLAVLLALVVRRLAPPPPKGSAVAASEFSAGRAVALLRELLSEGGDHPIGSAASGRVRQRLVGLLEKAGLTPEIQKAFVCGPWACANVSNVVARIPGRESDRAVLLAAHYDSAPTSPGGSDDGVGVAAIVEVARILHAEPARRNSVIVLISDAEEVGLLGAEAFASDHRWAREVGAVVNLEARGTSGGSIMFETSRENAWLVRALARSLPRPLASSVSQTIYQRMPNSTDLSAFMRHGMPGANFAFIGDVQHYHTPLDNLDNVDLGSLQHHGDNALAVTRALADTDLRTLPPGNAVFFDVLSLRLFWWPEGWTRPFSGGLSALALFALWRQRRRGSLSVGALAQGLAGALGAVAATLAAALGLAWFLRTAGRSAPWFAHPLPVQAAFWLLSMAVSSLVMTLLRRRTGPMGTWCGAWTLYAAMGVATAFTLPGVSYLALVPAAFAWCGLCLSRDASSGRAAWTVLLPASVVAVLWFPLELLLYDSMGVPALPVVAAGVAFLMITLSPLLAAVPGRACWALPAGSGLAAAGAILLTLTLAPYDVRRPERVGLVFDQQDDGVARWLANSESLPPSLAKAAPFNPQPTEPWSWVPGFRPFVAPTDRLDLPSPEFQVLQRSVVGDLRRVRLRLQSPRGASTLRLWLPSSARVESLEFGGKKVSVSSGPWTWYGYTCFTVPAEGIEVEIMTRGQGASVDAVLEDYSLGLPSAADPLVRSLPRSTTLDWAAMNFSRRITF